nr:MAG TPA: distal tail protein [Caudoviricetes sp.]
MSDVMLTANGASVTLHGGDFDGSGIALTGLSGWYQTPSPKVTVTSRGQGDGGHDIAADDIMYDARVVTVGYRIIAGADRGEALRQLSLLDRLVHGLVTCRVIDEGQDTYCSGGYYVRSLDQKIQNPLWQNLSGDITIVFERPERLSSQPQKVQIWPQADSGLGGLRYGGKATGLQYPVQYGVEVSDSRNACVLHNDGTSRAYPIFQATGPFPDGVAVAFQDGSSLSYSQPVGVTPLILDSRSHSATIGGVDVSRGLNARGFPVIEPGATLGVTLQSAGTGWVTCVTHDAYM